MPEQGSYAPDWMKKTRDDVPPNPAPLPHNPVAEAIMSGRQGQQGRCGTCRFWWNPEVTAYSTNMGICWLIGQMEVHYAEPPTEESFVELHERWSGKVGIGYPYTLGGLEGRGWALYTSPDFGCELWKAKETPPASNVPRA